MRNILSILFILIGYFAFGQGAEVNQNFKVKGTQSFTNGGTIYNTQTDTLFLEETNVKVKGNLTVTGSSSRTMANGCYADTVTRNMNTVVAKAVPFQTTLDTPVRITKTNDSLFYPTTAGVYLISISSVCDVTAGTGHVEMWVNVNGTNLPYSNTRLYLGTSEETILAVTFTVTITAGQYFKIMYKGDSASARLLFTAKASTVGIVAVPSTVLTVVKVSD